MKRRDFNRLALGAGVSPVFANPTAGAMVRRAFSAHSAAATKIQYRHQEFSPHIQPSERATKVCRRPSIYDLLDMELSLGGQSRCDRIGQSLFNHDGGASCSMAKLRKTGIFGESVFAGNLRNT